MTTMEQRILNRLRDKLRDDCATLTIGVAVEVNRDDGSKVRQLTPSLIHQLGSSVANSGEIGLTTIKRSRGLPIVISVQAFDILADINKETKCWNAHRSLQTRIQLTVAELCTKDAASVARMRYVAGHLDTWVRLIRELFNPPKRLHLAAPCPACGESTVNIYNACDTECVRAPALQITHTPRGHECECYACGACWPETHFMLLAQIIGCDPIVPSSSTKDVCAVR